MVDFSDARSCESPMKIYDVAEPLSEDSDINPTQLYLEQSQNFITNEPEQRVEILELYDLFLESLWDKQLQRSNKKVFNIELLDDLVQESDEDNKDSSENQISDQANPNEENDEMDGDQVFKSI